MVVVAVAESDLPPFVNDQDEVTYDYYHGYRLLDRDGIEPRFPFGFGLSYTTYAYGRLRLSDRVLAPDGTLEVRVDVTNTGEVAGEEIVQLYVHDQVGSVTRPVKALKGFRRIVLEPGETRTVEFALTPRELALLDAEMQWRVEPGLFDVLVGGSSERLDAVTLEVVE